MCTENTCFYCVKDQRLTDIMIEICRLSVSTVYLFREQTYRGRCLVAFNGHKNEMFDLTEEELRLFMKDVSKVASAVKMAFSPDKINYGAYGDKLPHFHFHVVPKYKDGCNWGGVFDMVPQAKTYLSDEEYNEIINLIKEAIGRIP